MATKTIAQLNPASSVGGNWLVEFDDGSGHSFKGTADQLVTGAFNDLDILLDYGGQNISFNNSGDFTLQNGGSVNFQPDIGSVNFFCSLMGSGGSYMDTFFDFHIPNDGFTFNVIDDSGNFFLTVLNNTGSSGNGFVGVNNFTPGFELDVAGQINCSLGYFINGQPGATGTFTNGIHVLTITNGLVTGIT
jgi:hypothetical protein